MTNSEQAERAKPYHERIRDLEKNLFPELTESDIYAPEGIKYFYFAPSWYFRSGFITETDVKTMLVGNKTVLSIGAGPAYLEKTLVDLGVPKENIVLSDIDPNSMPQDFKTRVFDMYAEWSDVEGEQFDFVFFPESTLFNNKFTEERDRIRALYHLILESVNHLKALGEMRMTHNFSPERDIEPVKRQFLRENADIEITYSDRVLTVKKA